MNVELFKQVLAAAKDMSYEQMKMLEEARNIHSVCSLERIVLDEMLEIYGGQELTDAEWQDACNKMSEYHRIKYIEQDFNDLIQHMMSEVRPNWNEEPTE